MLSDVMQVEPKDVVEGDALLFFTGGRPLHVGYALDRHLMLHNPKHASLIETWTGPSWFGKLEGVYRFA
jgi:cell wall-associated NlpC family hydrolase